MSETLRIQLQEKMKPYLEQRIIDYRQQSAQVPGTAERKLHTYHGYRTYLLEHLLRNNSIEFWEDQRGLHGPRFNAAEYDKAYIAVFRDALHAAATRNAKPRA